ncbi:MAG: hypothetical protein HY673_14935 [Chloroflexi bacterium]|nr:hypothetical protein [Chloroflexota bacterium]
MTEMFEPSSLKVLRYLRGYRLPRTRNDIIQGTGETPDYVTRALSRLAAEKIVTEENGGYLFAPGPESDIIFVKLADVCAIVSRGTQLELMVRGLLCATPQPCLVRISAVTGILASEGFSNEETMGFVQEEIRKGHVKKIKLLFYLRRQNTLPTYVPQEYVSPLSWVDMESYHQVGHYVGEDDPGYPSAHEEYLLGDYPREMANPAKEYLDTEKAYIKEKLREEAMRNWFFWLV